MNSKSEKSTLLAVFLKLLIFTVAIAAVGAGIGFGFYEMSQSLWIFIIAYVLGALIADLSVPAEYSWLKKTPEQKREKREIQSELDARYGSDREISDSVDQYGAGIRHRIQTVQAYRKASQVVLHTCRKRHSNAR